MAAFDDLAPENKIALEEAAEWHLRIEADPASEVSVEFQRWLAKGCNRRAMHAMERLQLSLKDLSASPDMIEARSNSLRRAQSLQDRQQDGHANGPRISRRTLGRMAAGFALTAVAGGSAWYYLTGPQSYATGVGMRRNVTLADGSRVSLDSNTEIQVSYSKYARDIELLQGQARFDVAHDKARPFSVTAGSETVVAVGTSFNVEKLDQKVLVTLINGKIVVKNSDAHPAQPVYQKVPVTLDAGEELEAVADTKPVIKKANIEATTAWITGQLIFRNTSLAEAVERENRYTDKPMLVDPKIADIRINGVFNAGDLASFVNAVSTLFPVQVTTNAEDQIILQPEI